MDIGERQRLRDEWRKEWIEELKTYRVGVFVDGRLHTTGNSKLENGHMFLVPDEVYKEWTKEE